MSKLLPLLSLAVFCLGLCPAPASAAGEQGKLRVVVITGGHGFNRNEFFKIFQGHDDIEYREVVQPKANDLYTPEARKTYDVIVMYDMWQKITAEQKKNLIARLNEGLPLVVLHHAIASYQDWPEYEKIIGARYYLQPTMVRGKLHPRSTYQHDVRFTVKIADPNHPITRGMADFEIVDETYNLFDVADDVHPLLTVEHEKSGKIIGWTHHYGNSRIVYIQLGHGPSAFGNENYRRLVAQAIRWVAGRLD